MKRILAVSLVWGSLAAAAEPPDTFRILALATRYEIGAGAEIRIVSDRIVEGAGTSEHRFALSHGSDAGRAVALDRASGSTLSSAPTGDGLRISLGTTLRARAERRLRIEEAADRAHYVRPHADGLIFEHAVPPGRITVVLPPGTVLGSSTLPVQTAVEDGRLKVGILNPGPEPLPVRLDSNPETRAQSAPARATSGRKTRRTSSIGLRIPPNTGCASRWNCSWTPRVRLMCSRC